MATIEDILTPRGERWRSSGYDGQAAQTNQIQTTAQPAVASTTNTQAQAATASATGTTTKPATETVSNLSAGTSTTQTPTTGTTAVGATVAPSVAPTSTNVTTDATMPARMSYSDIINKFGDYARKQKDLAEKRAKSGRVLTGLFDGLSALANLYYTTKGAVPQPLEPVSSALAADRLEKAKKEIDAEAAQKLNDYLRGRQLEDAWQQHRDALAVQREAAALAQSNWERRFAETQDYHDRMLSGRDDAQTERERHNKAMENRPTGRGGSGKGGGKGDDGMETVTIQGYNSKGQKETVRYKRPHKQDNSSKKTANN